MCEKAKKPRRKRKKKEADAVFHPYPLENPECVIGGDIVELSKGIYIRVVSLDTEYFDFDGDFILNARKQEKSNEEIIESCLTLLNNSKPNYKTAIINIMKHLNLKVDLKAQRKKVKEKAKELRDIKRLNKKK